MGKGTRENEIWHLEKEAKGRWQKETQEKHLGFIDV